jgi:hypothetical protein
MIEQACQYSQRVAVIFDDQNSQARARGGKASVGSSLIEAGGSDFQRIVAAELAPKMDLNCRNKNRISPLRLTFSTS